jgi:hypothetical protein
VSGRQGETALVVDLEDSGRRLLFEPLSRVSLVQSRRLGELSGGQRAAVGQRAIEAKADTEVDRDEVHRAERRLEEPLHQDVAPLGRLSRHL